MSLYATMRINNKKTISISLGIISEAERKKKQFTRRHIHSVNVYLHRWFGAVVANIIPAICHSRIIIIIIMKEKKHNNSN